MSFTWFRTKTNFKTFRKRVGDTDTEITDSYYVNQQLKWIMPFNLAYEDDFGYNAGGKPFMYTVEEISGNEHLIAYALDLVVDADILSGNTINPSITNTGTNKQKRLDGGDMATAGAGLTWTILPPDENVIPKTGHIIPALLSPFMLFKVNDIS